MVAMETKRKVIGTIFRKKATIWLLFEDFEDCQSAVIAKADVDMFIDV